MAAARNHGRTRHVHRHRPRPPPGRTRHRVVLGPGLGPGHPEPERLSLPVLAALCDIFECTPTDLIATRAENAAPRRTATGETAGSPMGSCRCGPSAPGSIPTVGRPCKLAEKVDTLLDDGTGRPNPQLEPLREAILAMPRHETVRTSALRQLVLQAPAPVIAQVLGFHSKTTTRVVAQAGGTWNRYASSNQKQ
ncbi:helix-turn-helix domain-containing protein [Nocardiopsis alkaliphila]|uniref:helix-turn-helix domain-containing protein n=1 Tax=Nocardiopsis alkaliphila TaxID=225762 RepID=UPI0023A9C481|nr:helix-turn-helix transcriptional regulator [Nocardiopsis alkaliphila]